MNRNRSWSGLLALVSVLLLIGPPALAADSTSTVLTATVSGDHLDVIAAVTNLPVGARLDPKAVSVHLDGTPATATVTPLDSTDQPLPRRAVMLVMDTSGSMAGAGLAGARAAASTFLDEVPADIEVGLEAFSAQARTFVAPTTDRRTVRAALLSLSASGETALYDAVALGVRDLGGTGQRALIVLSDGADTVSRTTLSQATASARKASTPLNFIAFHTSDAETSALAQMAAATGGRVLSAAAANQLASAFSTAARLFDTRVALSVALPQGLAEGDHQVTVSLTFGTVTASSSSSFTMPTGHALPTVDSAPQPGSPAAATGLPLAVLGLVFLALLALAVAVLLPVGDRQRARRTKQLEYYTLSGARTKVVSSEEKSAHGSVATSVLQLSSRVVARRGLADRMALALDRADMRFRPHEWLIVRVGSAVGAAAVLTLLLGNPLLGVLAGAALGWLATSLYVRVKASRRLKAFDAELPDTLQLIASSLQTGFSLQQALDAAVQDGREPISGELARALAETRLGAVLEDTLDQVGERMDNQDFRWTVMAIRIQRQVGGNLAEVLQTTVATMRERAAMRRQVRALSAEGRLSAYILIALPISLFLWLLLTRREYISLLWTNPLGLVMSTVAVVLTVLGWFWMRKVIRVEV